MVEKLTPTDYREVWLDERFHHCIIFEDEEAENLRAADFEPKTDYPDGGLGLVLCGLAVMEL